MYTQEAVISMSKGIVSCGFLNEGNSLLEFLDKYGTEYVPGKVIGSTTRGFKSAARCAFSKIGKKLGWSYIEGVASKISGRWDHCAFVVDKSYEVVDRPFGWNDLIRKESRFFGVSFPEEEVWKILRRKNMFQLSCLGEHLRTQRLVEELIKLSNKPSTI